MSDPDMTATKEKERKSGELRSRTFTRQVCVDRMFSVMCVLIWRD